MEVAAPERRLELLCDPHTLELVPPGNAADHSLAAVGGVGRVDGRPVACYAQDSSRAGGSVGADEAELIVRVLEQGARQQIPVVGFLESAGARLQDGVAALGGFGRIFSANVALSGRVPQISIVTGTAAGGGCYSPALTDFVVMTESASMFLTGPRVVSEALGEDVTAAALGGRRVHERNGVCHFVAPETGAAAAVARVLLGYLPQHAGASPPVDVPGPTPEVDPGGLVPRRQRASYDIRAVIRALVDGGVFLEDSARWARNIVVGFARINGRPIGVVANQPRHLGGVIDVDASQKGARFVRTCNVFGLPLLVLVDTPGFMPGRRQESAGVIRHGAELLRSFIEARVPRVTVIVRKAYGGAYITMNSRDLGADATFAWPTAEIGVMGASAAIQILHRRRLGAAASDGRLARRLTREYAREHISPAAAVRLGRLDAVIEPSETRSRVFEALAAVPERRGVRMTG